jgi:hypothetical protein
MADDDRVAGSADPEEGGLLEDLGELGRRLDEDRWRKRQNLPDGSRVFITRGRYTDLREALVARGWFQNPDVESQWFDLKWTVKSKDAYLDCRWPGGKGAPGNPNDRLREGQMVNHFSRASRITTKVGLMHSLRALRWFEPVDIASFFPRCFDLAQPSDFASFCDEFRATNALSKLVSVVEAALRHSGYSKPFDWVFAASSPEVMEEIEKALSSCALLVNLAVLTVAIRVCERRLQSRDASASCLDSKAAGKVLSREDARKCVGPRPASGSVASRSDWEVLLHCSALSPGDALDQCLSSPPSASGGFLPDNDADDDDDDDDAATNDDDDDEDEEDDEGSALPMLSRVGKKTAAASSSREARRDGGSVLQQRAWADQMALHGWDDSGFQDYDPCPDPRAAGPSGRVTVASDSPEHALGVSGLVPFELRRIPAATWKRLLDVLAATVSSAACQSTLDATPPANVWIIKPAGKSRGRGIKCMSNLASIVSRSGMQSASKSSFVAQKYIERPLLIAGRKFDIRQWVLVTCWNPLTVWFYADCYLRFCVRPFSLDPAALADKFVHLANNSIQKHSPDFSSSGIEGNMWTSHQFAAFLRETFRPATAEADDRLPRPPGVPATAYDLWTDWLQPWIRDTVVYSLKAAQDMADSRDGSFELYGYDFMIDSSLRPWLIEINSSPDMSYSTPTTEALVKPALADVVRVIVDHRDVDVSSRRRPRAARRREQALAVAAAAASPPRAAVDEAPPPFAGVFPPISLPSSALRDGSPTFVAPNGVDTGRWQLVFQATRAVTRPLGGLPHTFAARAKPLFPASSNR